VINLDKQIYPVHFILRIAFVYSTKSQEEMLSPKTKKCDLPFLRLPVMIR